MALSKRVLRELHQELKDLQSARDGAIARIGALEAVLNDAESIGRRDRTTRTGTVAGRSKQPSLPSSVLKLLQQVASSTAGDVARQLEASGFRVGGSTTLRERVAHELSRLRRKGVVRRARNGHYQLPAMSGSDPSSLSSVRDELVALN